MCNLLKSVTAKIAQPITINIKDSNLSRRIKNCQGKTFV